MARAEEEEEEEEVEDRCCLGGSSRVPISGPIKIALLLRKSNQDSHQTAGTLGSNQNARYGRPCTSGRMQLVIAYQETFFCVKHFEV